MFQDLRQGSHIYILHKKEPKLVIGEVTSKTNPVPVVNPTYSAGVFQPQKTTVDIKVKADGVVTDYQKLPSELSIADFGTDLVISESKEAISTEIQLLKKNSEDLLSSIDFHKELIEKCGKMLEELNPAVKQEAERAREIDSLKSEVKEMKEMLAEVLKSKTSKNEKMAGN